MAHFVFVLDRYYPEVDANMVCSRNVINCLKLDGHMVTCICGTSYEPGCNIVDGVTVYRIKHTRFDEQLRQATDEKKKRRMRVIHFIKSVLSVFSFPLTEKDYYLALRRTIEKVNLTNRIDCIIGVFRPYETVHAALRFGEMNRVPSIGYYLDIITGADKPFGVPAKFYYWLCRTRERKIFQRLDYILMATNGKSIYQSAYFDLVNNKIQYVDFPTLLFNSTGSNIEKGLFVYAGTTNSTFRNPLFTISVLKEIMKTHSEYSFYMYGSSTIEKEIKYEEIDSRGTFHYCGKVEKVEADNAIDKAEYLVSIGNADSVLVPSKIFELFSQGKPIIHFAKNNNDSVINYMKRYPHACIVFECEGFDIAVRKISAFLNKQFEPISECELISLFKDALPETVAKKIESVIA